MAERSYDTDDGKGTRSKTRAEIDRAKSAVAAPKQDDDSMQAHRYSIIFLVLLSISLQCSSLYLVMTDTLKLYPSTIRAEDLKGYASRAEFALRYLSLLIFWLLFAIIQVITARYKFSAFNPLTKNTEQNMASSKNVLANSYEQIIISAFSQLIFVSYADATLVLRVIPLVNILQFIGRITFWLGYPIYRGFGFNLTAVPNIILCFYNLYKFAGFVNIY